MLPSPSSLLLAALAWAALAVGAEAQADGRAGLTIGGAARATSLRGESTLMTGGTVLLHPLARLSVGAGGWFVPGVRRIDPDSPGGGLRLRVSYGGLVTGVDLGRLGPLAIGVRVLWGGGTARIELPVEETEIAADNFLVIEPEAGASVRLVSRLDVRLSGGYRAVSGVEDVSSVTGGQLRGAFAALGLAFRPW